MAVLLLANLVTVASSPLWSNGALAPNASPLTPAASQSPAPGAKLGDVAPAPAPHLLSRHILKLPSDDINGFRAEDGPASDPSVAWTLNLQNGSLVRGDFVPANGIFPIGIAFDSARGELFVADWGSDNVSVLSATNGSLLATVPVGEGPYGIDYDSAVGELFVADQYSNAVSVISDASDRVVATIPVGDSPEAVAVDLGRGEVYVANNGSDNVSVLSVLSNKVVATVAVGSDPDAVAYDSGTGELFVANWGSNSVSVVSDASNAVVATIGVEAGPDAVTVDAAAHSVFVADGSSDAVSVIADTNNTAYQSIDVGSGPSALAYDAGTGAVYVAAAGSNNVSVLSASSDTLVGTVAVGLAPSGIAYDAARSELYVVNSGSDNLTAISDRSNLPVAEIPLGAFPLSVAVDNGAGTIAVAENDTNDLTLIAQRNDMEVAATPVGVGPSGVAYDSGQGELVVANNGSNTVSVVSDSTDAVVSTIGVGSGPAAVAYDSGRGQVFVANANNSSNTVTVVSATSDSVVATVPVGYSPDALAYDAGRGEVFVANNLSGTVSVISDTTDKVVATIPVGPNPDGIAYDSGTSEIFVADRGSDNVSVISDLTDKVTAIVPVGFFPAGLAYDSGRDEVYVANELSDNVSVISDSDDQVVATVPVGLSPVGVAYDAATSQVFVTNLVSGTLSVITDGSAGAFSALLTVQVTNSSGDAVSGATVSVDGEHATTNPNGTAQFLLPNGTYNVSASAPEYLSTYANADLYGQDNVTLTLGYPFDFLGTIPAGDLNISAVFAGVNVSITSPFSGSAADVYFNWKLVGELPGDGTWHNFTTDELPDLIVLAAVPGSPDAPDAYYAMPGPLAGAGCGAIPGGAGASPPVTVNPNPPVYGEPTLVTVELHNTCPYTLHIHLLEIEIADFNAGGATFEPIGYASNISLAVSAYDNVSTVWNTTFNASDYGYHHCVRIQVDYGNPVPPQGSFVSGLHNLDVEPNILSGTDGSVGFTLTNPNATPSTVRIVVATQLLAGWTWSLELNGATYAVPEFNVTMGAGEQVAGTLTIDPSSATPGNGTVQVQEWLGTTLIGGLEKILQELPQGHYPVDFTESGLPSGTNWSVTVGGVAFTTSGTTVYANESDGDYAYTIGSVTGYTASPASGTVDVDGGPVTTAITFDLSGGAYCYSLSPGAIGVAGGLSEDFESDSSSASIDFQGGISLTPTLSVCLGTEQEFGFIPVPEWLNVTESLSESATATLTATGAASYSNLDNPYEFGAPVALGCAPVGLVLVCADATLDLGIQADLTAEADLSMDQGVTVQTSQNYSFSSGHWSTAPISASCQNPEASLALGCATFSAGATVQGSLLVELGPKISISALGLLGIYFWPYVGLNLSAGISTDNGATGSCGTASLGWSIDEPWFVACGVVGVQIGGEVLEADDFPAFTWTLVADPLGASVAVCASGGYPCGDSLYFTPNEAVTLEAVGAVSGLDFTWNSACLPTTEYGPTVTFTAPSTVGTVCTITVTTGLPLVVPSLGISETVVQASVDKATTVTFNEEGLPANTKWSVTAGSDGTTESTTSKSLAFTEPEGTVAYSVQGPSDYGSSFVSPAGATSPVNVSGPISITVKFGHRESLSFRETGLPTGHLWTVTIASAVKGGPSGQSATTSNTSVTFVVIADPYTWSVSSSSSAYEASHTHGTVGVSTTAKVEKIAFKAIVSKVTFAEKGLPAHSHWSVTIDGLPTLNGTAGSISLKLPSGTYDYTIATTRAGYTTDQQTGTVTVVAPKAVKVPITFADPPT